PGLRDRTQGVRYLAGGVQEEGDPHWPGGPSAGHRPHGEGLGSPEALGYGGQMNDFLFPRTLRGWKNLLLLTLRRCPQCYGSLLRDSVLYDDGQTVFCLP